MISGETDNSRPFKYAIDGGTNVTALAEKVPTTTTPALVATRSVVISNPGDSYNIMELICGGTDASGERFCLRVTRWFIADGATDSLYMPETALIAYPTLGLGQYAVSALGTTSNLWADSIALGAAQGAAKRPAGHKQPVRLGIEWAEAAYLEVEIELQTAASADVLYRFLCFHREARTRQLDGSFA